MLRRLFPTLLGRTPSVPANPATAARQALAAAEAQVRRNMHKRAVHVDFFGGIHVDPNWVYVDQKAAQRSVEALRAFMALRAHHTQPRASN